MAGEWKTAALDSLCELIVDCPHSTPVWTANGVVVLRSQNIRGGRLDLSSPSYTDEEHFHDRIRRAEPAAGDLVITREAPMGEVCQIPSGLRCCLGQRMVLLRPDRSQADGRYLLFALQSRAVQTQIMWAEGTGSTVSNLRIPDLKKLNIPSPPLPEQRAIAHVLGTLDDKIELNRRRNQTLEAMARALFKDWFVDFGPVRAKMEGRAGQDGQVSGQRHGGRASGPTDPYLPADLWQLFPDRLDDEGKPEGWGMGTLGDVTTELRRGISPSYLESGGVRVLNQKCIRNREINFGLARRHDHSKRKIEGREVMAGDILVNSTGVGTLGRVAQLWNIDEPTVVDSHVSVVRPNTNIVSVSYLGLSLTGREAEIEMLGEGSTGQTELSRVRLGSLPVLVPPREVLDQFDAAVLPLLNALVSSTEESTTLAQLRDTLLPKLISGELRIADAERFIEERAA